ncbi:hypothetical protein GGR54DRAFT_647959 [Hypoxylon sp. NC1633]|nr:hypothetical protein GGR54DRAFT_647959 [Hypoxylon sp. NC1633]
MSLNDGRNDGQQAGPAGNQQVFVHNDAPHRPLHNPHLIHDDFNAIEHLSTQTVTQVLAHCQKLAENYRMTGNAEWVEERRLILHKYSSKFDAAFIHLVLNKRSLKMAMEERLEFYPAAEAPASPVNAPGSPVNAPGSPEHTPGSPAYALGSPEYSPGHRDRAPSPEGPAPPPPARNGAISSQEEQKYWLDQAISYRIFGRGTIEFTLRFRGPITYCPPTVLLGRPTRNSYHVESWRPSARGAPVKRYVVLAYGRNLELVLQAYNFLKCHKDKLVRKIAGSRKLPLTRGHIYFRDLNLQGQEETRCPITDAKVESEDIDENDMVFWVEEEALKWFHNLLHDIATCVRLPNRGDFRRHRH